MMNPAFDKDKWLQQLDQRNIEKYETQMAQLGSDMDQNLAHQPKSVLTGERYKSSVNRVLKSYL